MARKRTMRWLVPKQLFRAATLVTGSILGGAAGFGCTDYGVMVSPCDEDRLGVEGQVVDAATGAPIPGIEVMLTQSTGSGITDQNGEFVVWGENEYSSDGPFQLRALDIDGEKNGSYEPASAEFDAEQTSEGSKYSVPSWQAWDVSIEMDSWPEE